MDSDKRNDFQVLNGSVRSNLQANRNFNGSIFNMVQDKVNDAQNVYIENENFF